jgi:hypothetical protein
MRNFLQVSQLISFFGVPEWNPFYLGFVQALRRMNQAPGVSGGTQDIIRNYAALVEELASKDHVSERVPDFV